MFRQFLLLCFWKHTAEKFSPEIPSLFLDNHQTAECEKSSVLWQNTEAQANSCDLWSVQPVVGRCSVCVWEGVGFNGR